MSLFNIQNPFKRKEVTSTSDPSQFQAQNLNPYGNSNVSYLSQAPKPTTSATQQNPVSYLKDAPKTPTTNPFAPKPVDTSGITGVYNNQKEQQKNYLDQTTGYINQVANLNNQALNNQIPVAQDAFNRFKTNTEQSVADQQAQAERAKMSAEENFGTAQKQGAMTRQESENRIRNQYASNNAMDSYGAGSYRAASSQLEGQFNQFTQQNIQNKVDQINQIDTEIVKFSNEAKNLIADQEAQLTQLINNINSQVGMNEVEKNYAIQTAQMQYQERVGEIDAYLQGLEMQKQQLSQEANQAWQLVQSLSPTFKATGQPQTQEDYMFMQTQPNMYEQMFGTYKDRQTNQTNVAALQEKGDTIALINSILSKDTNPITGIQRFSNFGLSQETNDLKAQMQQLKSQLELASAGKLKGQGTITESERKILSDSVLALNAKENGTYAISDDFLRQQLNQAKQILQRSGATASTFNQGNAQTIRVREIRSGQTGSIPVNEFDPSLYERI